MDEECKTMTRWMDRPAGLRQLIQDCVFKDRLLPTEQGPQSLADLAVLNKEWQQEVEKFTFKTLRLDVCEGSGGQTELPTSENGLFYDTPRAVGTVMNSRRMEHLRKLTFQFVFPTHGIGADNVAIICKDLQGNCSPALFHPGHSARRGVPEYRRAHFSPP